MNYSLTQFEWHKKMLKIVKIKMIFFLIEIFIFLVVFLFVIYITYILK